MKPADQIGFTFVTVILSYGFSDGIVNIAIGAQPFDPMEGEKIDVTPTITGRLRLTEPAARNLHDLLGKVLHNMDAARASNGKSAEPTAADHQDEARH